MMERIKKYLSDILISIDLIENFSQATINFADYQNDIKTQSAVERQLAIIGEVLNRLSKENDSIEIRNSKQIIGLRNCLIHAYDSIDNAIIWARLKNHLPKLKIEILGILFPE